MRQNLRYLPYVGGAVLVAVAFVGTPQYYLHIMITILIWSLAYTSWSLMGRFGLVSLGHGAFMGVGAYVTALLWTHFEVTPWIGIPAALATTAAVAFIVGYPCFRFRITGHYFALVTLALSEVVRLVVMATRDHTGGSLGFTPTRYGEGTSVYALQFADREVFYLIVLGAWAVGLVIWRAVDRSMMSYALNAISEDEDAAAASGVAVTATKLKITILSAVMTAFAGVLYTQYQMFIAPDTVSGIFISLQIVFAVVAGGMYVMLGPTVGAVITILLAETLRVGIGVSMVGLDTTIYGVMLILFIIFLPRGVLGEILYRLGLRAEAAAGPPDAAKPAAAKPELEKV